MAKKKTKEEKQNKKSRKKMDIAAVAVIDNIVFSEDEIYAYYEIENNVFDFLSTDEQVNMSLRISNAFNNVMQSKEEPVDGHIIVTSIPYDIDSWVEQVKKIAEDWETGPGFDEYVHQQEVHLKNKRYIRKVTYIGFCLGKRGALDMGSLNVFETGIDGAKEYLGKWLSKSLSLPTSMVSEEEEANTRVREGELYRTLHTGHLHAERPTSEDLLLVLKRQFWPAMPAPYLNVDHDSRLGPGDLDLELGSVIENKYRWLKFNQMYDDIEMTGYRATLTLAKFPKHMYFPMNFPYFYFITKLGAPFTCYSRFTLFPSQKMKLDLEKKKKEQVDELENINAGQDQYSSAINGGAPAAVSEALQDIQHIDQMLHSDKTPWVEGSYRIVVEADTEDRLKDFCATIKQNYDDLGIFVQWSAGDQAELFQEQMIGDKHRIKSFSQTTNLNMLPASGMNFSSDIGDPIYASDKTHN